jgi:tape measure domain-containing protein
MADNEKIGTLEYDMIINEKLLKKQLAEIDKLLKEQDAKWKEALSNVGAGYAAGTEKLVTANTKTVKSVKEIGDSIKALEKDLKKNISLRKSMSDAERSSDTAVLNKINNLKLQLDSEKKLYDQKIKLATEAANAEKKLSLEVLKYQESLNKARIKLTATQPNSIQRIDAEKHVLTTQFKEPGISDAQTKALSVAVNENRVARKNLIATIKQQEQAEKQAAVEEKLRIGINAQAIGSIGRLRAEIALYTYQLSQIKKITPESTKQIELLNQSIASNRQQIQSLQPSLGLFGKLKSAIVTYATAYLSVQAAIGSARAIFDQTKGLDQLAFSMKTVIKSATELAQTQKFLGEVAVNYGGDLLTLSARYIKFRAAAMQSNMSAEETQKIFNSVSKAAGTLGLKTDELAGVYLALEQMISKGKVTTEELRRQLGERLPGAFGIMANALGVTIPMLDKMLKQGKILSADALPKFAIALEKAYGIESLTKIDTLAAAQGRLSTQTTLLIKAMEASGTFKKLINSLSDMLGFVTRHIAGIGLLIRAFISLGVSMLAYRAGMAASILVQQARIVLNKTELTWMSKLTEAQYLNAVAIRNSTAATTLLGRAWKSLTVAFASNPFGIIAVGLIAIGTAIYEFTRNAKEAEAGTKSFADNMSEQTGRINTLFDTLGRVSKRTNLYKETLFELNTLIGKYLPNLLTEASSYEELAKARELSNKGLIDEINLLEQREQISKANDTRKNAQKAAYEKILTTGIGTESQRGQLALALLKASNEKDVATSLTQVEMIINDFLKRVNVSSKDLTQRNAISDYVQIIRKAANDLIGINVDYNKKVISIKAQYPADEPTAPKIFDIASIETHKKAYEDAIIYLEKGKNDLIDVAYFDPKLAGKKNTLVDWFNEEIKKVEEGEFKNKTDALKALYKGLAEAIKNEGKTSGKKDNTALDALKERLDLLKKMKASYDDLRVTMSADKAAKEVAKQFEQPMKDLNVEITPRLDTENFIQELQLLAKDSESINKELSQTISELISTTASKDAALKVSDTLDAIEREIEAFKKKSELQQTIFNITGIDRGIVTDDIQFLKEKIVEMANSTNDIQYGGSFDALLANIDKVSPLLKSKIESVQKYIADKSASTLLDALKFVYQELPEGVDIQFDFSKILTELNIVLGQAKIDIENFTKEDIITKSGGLVTAEAVRRKGDAIINAQTEKAKDSVEKLAATYIKSNLTQQMRNDFKNMSDASIESIRNISKALDKMMVDFMSKGSLQKLFSTTKIDASKYDEILGQLSSSKDADSFKTAINEINQSIRDGVVLADGFNIGSRMFTPAEKAELETLLLLIEKIFGELQSAIPEVRWKGLEKLLPQLQKLEQEIGNVIDSAVALSEAFGTKMSESARASLDAIKMAATGIVDIIGGVSKLASSAIGSVEKASVALGIVSTAMKIITSIVGASKKAEEERYNQEQALLDIASKYNIALRQRNVLLEQSKIIFGDDKYKESISYIDQMTKATNALKIALDKVRSAKTPVTLSIIGGKQIFTEGKLISQYKDLFKDGEFDLLRAKQLLADGTAILTDDAKRALEEAVTAMEDYQKSLTEFEAYLSGIFGDLGNSMMDAIINNLDSTENALREFTTYASSTLEKLFRDIAYSMYLAPIFTQLQKDIEGVYKTADVDKGMDTATAILKVFDANKSKLDDAAIKTQKLINDIKAAANQTAFPVFTGTKDSRTTVSEIKGVTEDTARRLEGLMNSIRETGVLNLGNAMSLVESNRAIQAYSAQSLSMLVSIDMTTKDQLKDFRSVMATATGTLGGSALKVVMA